MPGQTAHQPLSRAQRRGRARKGKLFPPPKRSGRIYCCIDPSLVGMFRFLLEAADNLGIMTVVDRWRAVLQVRFSPHQEKDALEHLEGMRETLPFSFLPLPGREDASD